MFDEYGRIRSEFGALIQNENELDGYAHKAMAINNITEEQLNNAASKADTVRAKFVDWWNALPKEQGITLSHSINDLIVVDSMKLVSTYLGENV